MNAMDKLEAACNAKRREWYGEEWQSRGWYGNKIDALISEISTGRDWDEKSQIRFMIWRLEDCLENIRKGY